MGFNYNCIWAQKFDFNIETLRFLKTTFFKKNIQYYIIANQKVKFHQFQKKNKKCEQTLESYLTTVLIITADELNTIYF